jgi:hypothetical protein
MSNSALSVIRAKVRRLLNEATAEFWSDAVLNDFIQNSFDHYYRAYTEINPEFGRKYEDITYTASAEYYDITATGGDIESILFVEDRTNYQPGPKLQQATSLVELQKVSYPAIYTSLSPCFWYFEKVESITTGVVTIKNRLYLGPKPGSAKSLRLHVQAGPQPLAGDAYTTGMPDFVERCIILGAAIDAKLMEASPNIRGFQELLMQAEQRLMNHSNRIGRGNNFMDYDPDLFE